MRLRLKRIFRNKNKTLGILQIIFEDEVLVNLKTIELPWRDNKRNISSIPSGVYDVVVGHNSPRFGWTLWLQDVPNRSEILVHQTSFVRQLRGCIAPGLFHKDIDKDGIIDVSNSRDAMSVLKIYLGGFRTMKLEIVDPVIQNYVETHTEVPNWTDHLKNFS